MDIQRGIVLPSHIQFTADQAPVFGESPNDEDEYEDEWDTEYEDDEWDDEDEIDDPQDHVGSWTPTNPAHGVQRAITWTKPA